MTAFYGLSMFKHFGLAKQSAWIWAELIGSNWTHRLNFLELWWMQSFESSAKRSRDRELRCIGSLAVSIIIIMLLLLLLFFSLLTNFANSLSLVYQANLVFFSFLMMIDSASRLQIKQWTIILLLLPKVGLCRQIEIHHSLIA